MGIFRVLRALWHGQNDAWSVLRQWDLPISLWDIVNHAGVDVENGRQGLTGHTVRHTRHSTVNRPVKWCADICDTVRVHEKLRRQFVLHVHTVSLCNCVESAHYCPLHSCRKGAKRK